MSHNKTSIKLWKWIPTECWENSLNFSAVQYYNHCLREVIISYTGGGWTTICQECFYLDSCTKQKVGLKSPF